MSGGGLSPVAIIQKKGEKMKKVVLIILLCCVVGACGVKKPPLAPTQLVDGRSIIVPPEFDVVPEKEK